MSSSILYPIERPVVQIQLQDLEPLQGAAQEARIASTILYLATHGLQVHFPPVNVEITFDPIFCDPRCGRIAYTINLKTEDPGIVLKALEQCLHHHPPSSGITFTTSYSRALSYQPSFPPLEPTQ